MKTKVTLFYIVLTAVLLLAHPRSAAAGEPTEQIRSAVGRGIEVLNRGRLDTPAGKSETIERLKKAVYPLFDFDEMARRSLGVHWRGLDERQQREFVAAFTDLLEATYARHIDLYDGQKVSYTGEKIDEDFAVVNTRLVGKKGESYAIDYKLHRAGDRWKIYDVVAEGISVVNNYRSQFNRVMANSTIDVLIKKMREKSA